MVNCIDFLVGYSDQICNSCNLVDRIRSSPFYLEDVGKLSNLVKSFIFSLVICIRAIFVLMIDIRYLVL